jgi:signal transduction histidine kinase
MGGRGRKVVEVELSKQVEGRKPRASIGVVGTAHGLPLGPRAPLAAGAEGLLRGHIRVLEMIARGASLRPILESVIELVETQSGALGSILLLEPNGRLRAGPAPNLPPDYTRMVDGIQIGPTAGSCGTAAFRGELVIVSDIASDPLWRDAREVALAHGLRACWSRPIVSAEGVVLGTLAMYYRESRRPSPFELDVVEAAAHLAGIAIERRSSEEVIARAHAALEERVAARTHELTAANERERYLQAELVHVVRLSTMGEMTSNLAHELNQPLSAIVAFVAGCARRLEEGETATSELITAMREAEREALRAGEIIRHLREFVRRKEPQQSPVQVNEVMREVLSLLATELRLGEVKVTADLAGDLPLVSADRIQIAQVLINLLRNASEAMAAARPPDRRLWIRTRVHSSGEIEVVVEDSGPGFKPAVADRIFEPYVTTKPQGLGMGLAISRTIVQAHGGTITAERRGGEPGVRFRFTLSAAGGES